MALDTAVSTRPGQPPSWGVCKAEWVSWLWEGYCLDPHPAPAAIPGAPGEMPAQQGFVEPLAEPFFMPRDSC